MYIDISARIYVTFLLLDFLNHTSYFCDMHFLTSIFLLFMNCSESFHLYAVPVTENIANFDLYILFLFRVKKGLQSFRKCSVVI